MRHRRMDNAAQGQLLIPPTHRCQDIAPFSGGSGELSNVSEVNDDHRSLEFKGHSPTGNIFLCDLVGKS
jgi:hypothetical protein